MNIITYGLGGYDPKAANGGIVSIVEVDVTEPLEAAGTLAALLVTKGVLTLAEAARSVKLDAQQLIDEAQSWDVAAVGDERRT